MKRHAVIDTNVIVSSFIHADSMPAKVVTAPLIVPIVSPKIVDEYKDVLYRPKFSFNKDSLDTFFNIFLKRAIHLSDIEEEIYSKCIDISDQCFYNSFMAMLEITDDSYLVTGNKKDFPAHSHIVSPREMVEIACL